MESKSKRCIDFKLIIFSFFVLILVVYLKYSETYYSICNTLNRMSNQTMAEDEPSKSYMVYDIEKLNKTKLESLSYICSEFQIDYSNHTLTNYTLNLLFKFLYSKNSEIDKNIFIDTFQSIELSSFKMNLVISKIVHYFIFVSLMYFVLVCITEFLINMIFGTLNKLLLFIFFVFVLDGGLKLFFDLNLDIIVTIRHYYALLIEPMKIMRHLVKKAFNLLYY